MFGIGFGIEKISGQPNLCAVSRSVLKPALSKSPEADTNGTPLIGKHVNNPIS